MPNNGAYDHFETFEALEQPDGSTLFRVCGPEAGSYVTNELTEDELEARNRLPNGDLPLGFSVAVVDALRRGTSDPRRKSIDVKLPWDQRQPQVASPTQKSTAMPAAKIAPKRSVFSRLFFWRHPA